LLVVAVAVVAKLPVVAAVAVFLAEHLI